MTSYTIHQIFGNNIFFRINLGVVSTFYRFIFFRFMAHIVHLLFLFFPVSNRLSPIN